MSGGLPGISASRIPRSGPSNIAKIRVHKPSLNQLTLAPHEPAADARPDQSVSRVQPFPPSSFPHLSKRLEDLVLVKLALRAGLAESLGQLPPGLDQALSGAPSPPRLSRCRALRSPTATATGTTTTTTASYFSLFLLDTPVLLPNRLRRALHLRVKRGRKREKGETGKIQGGGGRARRVRGSAQGGLHSSLCSPCGAMCTVYTSTACAVAAAEAAAKTIRRTTHLPFFFLQLPYFVTDSS